MSIPSYTPLTDAELNGWSNAIGPSAERRKRAAAEIRALRAVNAELVSALRAYVNVEGSAPILTPDAESRLERGKVLLARAEGRARTFRCADFSLTNNEDAYDSEFLGQYPDTPEGVRDAALEALDRLGWSILTSSEEDIAEGRAEG